MAKALIVVDVQNDFCEGGSLGVDGGLAVAESIRKLIDPDGRSGPAQGKESGAAKGGHDYVVATRDHHIDPGSHFSATPDFVDSWPPHCVVGTPGQDLTAALVGYPFDAVFDKGSYRAAYSGFEGTIGGEDDGVSLGDWLESLGVTEVDVVGIATDYCVKQTAEDAARHGLTTTVLLGHCATIHPDNLDDVKADWQTLEVAWK